MEIKDLEISILSEDPAPTCLSCFVCKRLISEKEMTCEIYPEKIPQEITNRIMECDEGIYE